MEHRSATHVFPGDLHALRGTSACPKDKAPVSPALLPRSEATGTSLPQDSACSWCWQQGRDGAEAGPSWDKAPFTAQASHAPSSASASCHQLALLPRTEQTVGGGGQGWGLTLPVQSLEERELPLLHILSPVPTPAPPAVPPPTSPTETRWLHPQWYQHFPGKSPKTAGTWHPAIFLSSLLLLVPEALQHWRGAGERQRWLQGGGRLRRAVLSWAPLGTAPCLNLQPSLPGSSPPQCPGPPQCFAGYSFTPRVETTCISLM